MDYTASKSWGAWPDNGQQTATSPGSTANLASLAPSNTSTPVCSWNDAEADCFFLHSTSYFGGAVGATPHNLNQPPGHAASVEKVDHRLLAYAACWNGHCRMYAPYYRQASMEVYLDAGKSRVCFEAFEAAYQDCLAAFKHYLAAANDGRPFFLVGYSQGAHHLTKLLAEVVDGDEALRDKLVAAYVVGGRFPNAALHGHGLGDKLAHIPRSTSPLDVGCVLAWDTFADGVAGSQVPAWFRMGSPVFSVNPVTWKTDKGDLETPHRSDQGDHKGLLPFNGGMNNADNDRYCSSEPMGLSTRHLPSVVPSALRAQVREGFVYVTLDPPVEQLEIMDRSTASMHVHDIALFWEDIRQNVGLRLRAYVEKRAAAGKQKKSAGSANPVGPSDDGGEKKS
eukprot:m.8403 g.8403  ORF g.8403 m.8403 type:complete len:395 (-) comp3225_c0_seq1:167-1351(-)